VDLCAAKLFKEVGDEWDQILILLSDLVEVLEVNTELQSAILLFSKNNRCAAWRLGQSDEPLAEHIIEEFMKETELFTRDQNDVAVRETLQQSHSRQELHIKEKGSRRDIDTQVH